MSGTSEKNKYTYATATSFGNHNPNKIGDLLAEAILDKLYEDAAQTSFPLDQVYLKISVTVFQDTISLFGELRGPKTFYMSDPNNSEEVFLDDVGAGVINVAYLHQVVSETMRKLEINLNWLDWKTFTFNCNILSQPFNVKICTNSDVTVVGYACSDNKDGIPAAVYYSEKVVKEIERKIKEKDCHTLTNDIAVTLVAEYINGHFHSFVRADVSVTNQEYHSDLSGYEQGIVSSAIETALVGITSFNRQPHPLFDKDRFWSITANTKTFLGTSNSIDVAGNYGSSAPTTVGSFGMSANFTEKFGTYLSRFLAKEIVQSGMANAATLTMSYNRCESIPTFMVVDLHGTGAMPEEKFLEVLHGERVTYIAERVTMPEGLDLYRPIFLNAAMEGRKDVKTNTVNVSDLVYKAWEEFAASGEECVNCKV